MKQDLKNNFNYAQSVTPAARIASVNGTGVDLSNYNSNAVVLLPGTITDGSHTPKLQESDDNATFTDVAASDQIGSFALLTSNTTQKVGYIGTKRYIRVVVTVAGATTGGVYGALVVLGDARSFPQ
jgi:hypothetical protein